MGKYHFWRMPCASKLQIFVKAVVASVLLVLSTAAANAAMVNLDIQMGSDSGFRYSYIHGQEWGPMSGYLWYSLDGTLSGDYDGSGQISGISGDIALTGLGGRSDYTMSITSGDLNSNGSGHLEWSLGSHSGYISFSDMIDVGPANGFTFDGSDGLFAYWGQIVGYTQWGEKKLAGIDLGGDISAVPLPPAAFLFLSALIGLFTVSKRKSADGVVT